jgi:hypothetical protein
MIGCRVPQLSQATTKYHSPGPQIYMGTGHLLNACEGILVFGVTILARTARTCELKGGDQIGQKGGRYAF